MPRPADSGDVRGVAATLPARHAFALGLLHGPAELLPVSSSGHTTLVPWLLGWPYPELDGELRKAFEVALHAGTAVGLLIALRCEVAEAAHGLDRRRVGLLTGSFLPPAAAGLLFERPIEQRLGTAGTIAGGLAVGAVAMVAADALGARTRTREDAGLVDALALGAAQVSALIPGLSRGGMTLAAMRARGFARGEASALSRHVALPVIAGASVLKAARLARSGVPPGFAGRLALGAGASLVSTLAAARLVPVERVGALWPYAAYRGGLAALTWRRLTCEHRRR
jgi:undecaprenyl-diphosphatase